MLHIPSGVDFRWQLDSEAGVRPAAAFGTTVTGSGSTNTKGSYANVISTPTAYDAFGILINVNSIAVSASSRQVLLDIGIDEAGGTSYSVKIANLYCTNASPYNVGSGGVWFYFPLFIPAGSTIGARLQGTTASQTARCRVILYGRPTRPEMVRFGTFVETLGATTGSSSGTSITAGTTSEGSYVSLGSPSKSVWWFQVGWGQNDASTQAAAIHLDIAAGDASNKKMLIEDLLICNAAAEQQNNAPLTVGCSAEVDASATIYARAQGSAAADTSQSVIVYAMG